ncbi:unnamed protein product [Absidia cylindrospora]
MSSLVMNTVCNLIREYGAGTFLLLIILKAGTSFMYGARLIYFRTLISSGGEPPSKASADRKNQKRKFVQELKQWTGRILDDIATRITVEHEQYGASEISLKCGNFNTKAFKRIWIETPKNFARHFQCSLLFSSTMHP